jgi:hypothetical protein
MNRNIENILYLAADMQSFCPAKDELSHLIDRHTVDELSEFDLDFVAAAASIPSYADYLKRAANNK